MQNIELYIEGQRLDLFEDESVSLNQTIKNARDVAKVFTDFTQSFNVPASKTNNKIFKHFYNFDIVDGFDARIKVAGTIELNSFPFKDGKIKLEGVKLKENQAYSYKITFFGDISKLKDQLGGDKLSDIDFSGFDKDYSSSEVLNSLQTSFSDSTSIITPLITHTQRLFYDSGNNDANTGNLHFHGSGGGNNNHGVKWNELKYAIRVNTILQQIELQYNLEFSTDFFRNVNVTEMHGMFLWLHRKSGKVEDLSGADQVETLVNFNQINNVDLFNLYNTSFCVYYPLNQLQLLRLLVSPASGYSTTLYGIRIEENGIVVYNSGLTLTGVSSLSAGTDWTYSGGCYEVYLETGLDMQFSGVQWQGRALNGGTTYQVIYNSGALSATDVFRFNVQKQMPDITILNFLTGLFKIFNLTAYAKDGKIVVKTLDDFYSDGQGHLSSQKGIDISEYIDIESSSVDVALPFREIFFNFEDTKTFLANRFGEITNRAWGQLSYTAGEENLDGGTYQVKAPFGHLLYERLNDANGGTLKNIQWGYNVNNDQSAYLGKPLLFYPIRIDTGGIGIVNEVNSDNVATSHIERNNIIMPFNTVVLDPSVNDFQLNYFQEVNEWTRNENGQIFTGDLFSKYYSNYIGSIFNNKNRLTKVTAYLPLKILLNFTLADRFDINGQRYKINSIKTNLKTGKSDIELLNEL